MKKPDQVAAYLGMDKDTDGRVMNTAEGYHPHAENLHMEPLKIPSSMDGTVLVDTPFPAGNNIPNGSYWDRREDTVFDFWWNSLGNHSITRRHVSDGYTTVIVQSPLLGFNVNFHVTAIGLVDGQYLYWTNDLGNPMCIDLQRAEDDGTKKSKIRVYFPRSEDVQQRVFGVTVLNPSSVPVGSNASLHTSAAAEVLAFAPMLENVANAFNAGFLTRFTATACNDYIEFEAVNTGLWQVEVVFTDTTSAGIQPQVTAKQETRNRYSQPWVREQLDMAAFMPPYAPVNSVDNDPKRTVNMIGKRVFRFAYAYIFRDRGNSPLSPWSLPAYIPVTCSSGAGGNIITIDISADYNLASIGPLSEIDCMELFYQESTDAGWPADWQSAGIYTKDKWIYPLTFEFANDTVPVIVDRTYSDIFAWSVPLAAKASTQIVDQDSNNRIMLANTVEGYETPCVNVDLTLNLAAAQGAQTTVDIEVWVKVCNLYTNYGFGFWSAQPIWQRSAGTYRIGGMGLAVVGIVQFDADDCDQTTATGGFPIYIAGTSFLAITEQIVPSASSTSVNFVPNTTVLDGTNLGASINPGNTSGRTAISILTAGGDIYQRAVITGVPSGQDVVIRVADAKCDFLDDGSILDLNNPALTYQRTSDKIFGIEPSLATSSLSPNAREIRVSIPNGATGTIFAGSFLYADCCEPDAAAIKTCTFKGYGFDDNGDNYSPSNDIRNTGTSMERTWYGIYPFDPGTGQPPLIGITIILGNAPGAQFWAANGVTAATQICEQGMNASDHNGFYFLPFKKAFNSLFFEYNWRMATVSITGDPTTPIGVFAGYTTSGIQVLNLTVLNDFADDKWIGTLADAVLTGPDNGNLDKSGRYKDYIIANVNPDARAKIRTHVRGAVIAQGTSDPVPNVPVVMETGRWTTTDQFGFFDIPVYGSMNNNWVISANNNDRTDDGVLFMWTGTCDADFIGGNYVPASLVNIYRFWEDRIYSDAVGLTLAPMVIDLTPQAQGPFLKRWGVYDVGGMWIDQHGRPSPVEFLKRFEIPGVTDDLNIYDPVTYPSPLTFKRGLASINWSILSPPEIPEYGRFRRFQLVITPNQGYSRWLQWSPSHALYVSRWDNSTHLPIITTASSGSAREIYLGFTDGFQRYRELNSGASTINAALVTEQFGQIGWLWQRGDRMRIITKSNGSYQSSTIDVEITGQYGIYLIIENSSTIPEMVGGEIVELYRPGVLQGESKTYREIPGAYAEIADPFGTPSWVTTTGVITGADNWNIATQIPVRPGYESDTATPNVPWSSRSWLRESMAITDFWTSTVDGLGRVGIEDLQASQRRRGTAIRVSNPYQPGTARNGIRLFEPLNIKVANTDYGLIQFMEEMDMVVVIPCSAARTFAIYISRTLITSGDDDLITIGNDILGTMRPMAKRFGTVNPESMVRGDTFMFWVDAITGAIVRYDVNGVKSVSKRGINTWFAEYCRRIVQYPNYKFFGGINTSFSEYWVTIKAVSRMVNGIDDTAGGESIIFWYADSDEALEANKFSCMVTAVADYYGRSSGRMYSMKRNEVWLHDADPDNQNVIYGVKRPLAVEVMFNADPSRKKIFLALQADSGTGWYCPSIKSGAQFSNLIKEDFVVDQDIAKAPVLKDVNTPVPNPITHGDPMVGTTLAVRFQNDCDAKVTLASSGLHHRMSPET